MNASCRLRSFFLADVFFMLCRTAIASTMKTWGILVLWTLIFLSAMVLPQCSALGWPCLQITTVSRPLRKVNMTQRIFQNAQLWLGHHVPRHSSELKGLASGKKLFKRSRKYLMWCSSAAKEPSQSPERQELMRSCKVRKSCIIPYFAVFWFSRNTITSNFSESQYISLLINLEVLQIDSASL